MGSSMIRADEPPKQDVVVELLDQEPLTTDARELAATALSGAAPAEWTVGHT
jgi:hypothetical protein